MLYTPFAGGSLSITQGIGEADPSHGHIPGENGPFNDHFYYALDFDAGVGTEVVSPGIGTIQYIYRDEGTSEADYSEHYGLGNYVTLRLDSGEVVTTSHAPVGAFADYEVGDRVSAGQVLHTVGTTGTISGPHIHFQWGVELNDDPLWNNRIADSREDSLAWQVHWDPGFALSGTTESSFSSIHYGTIQLNYGDDPIKIYALKTADGIVYDGDAQYVEGTDKVISVGDLAYAGADTLSAGNNGWITGKTGADTYEYTVGHGSVVINDDGSTLASEIDTLRIYSPNLLDGITVEDTITFTPTDNFNDLQLTFNYNQPVASGTVTINDFFTERGRIERLELYGESEAYNQSFLDNFDLLGYWINPLSCVPVIYYPQRLH